MGSSGSFNRQNFDRREFWPTRISTDRILTNRILTDKNFDRQNFDRQNITQSKQFWKSRKTSRENVFLYLNFKFSSRKLPDFPDQNLLLVLCSGYNELQNFEIDLNAKFPEFSQSLRHSIFWTLGTKIRPNKPKYVWKVLQK
jgi:hypothetical protein